MTPAEQIQFQISSLSDALSKALPTYATLLRDIRKQLNETPECVTLLSEEDISVVIRGAEKFSGFQLAESVVSKKSTAASQKKQIAQLNLDEDI